MDGLRKVLNNTEPRDDGATPGQTAHARARPFSNEYPSFGAANNARLRVPRSVRLQYELLSSTECYTSGRFDATRCGCSTLRPVRHEVASLREGARKPIRRSYDLPRTAPCCRCRLCARRRSGDDHLRGSDSKERDEFLVMRARKLQWKPDWAMRWVLGVDYEMAGRFDRLGQAV
jgi:lysyl-tRNA synthetase class 1